MMARTLKEPSEARRRRSAAPRPRIRETAFGDYAGIAALHARNGLATRPQDDWIALWRGNPAYSGQEGRWPIGWVLEAGDSRIVGSIGNIPLAYHFRGRELRAGAACSWAVDPGYRNCSMLMLERLTRQPGADFLISTTVSAAAEPAFGVFQWSRVPAGTWRESAFWITNYRGFLKSALTVKSVPLAGPLSYAISPLLFCRDRVMSAFSRSNGSLGEIEPCAGFDLRFDAFWDELKHENPDALMAVRARESLAWHFRYSLSRERAWIVTLSRSTRLAAYAVFDRFDSVTWGVSRIRLVDFAALRGFESALGAMVRFMTARCRREGIDMLEYTGGWPQRLHASAPYRRVLPSWMYYYRASGDALREALKDPRVWAPSSFDGDACL